MATKTNIDRAERFAREHKTSFEDALFICEYLDDVDIEMALPRGVTTVRLLAQARARSAILLNRKKE